MAFDINFIFGHFHFVLKIKYFNFNYETLVKLNINFRVDSKLLWLFCRLQILINWILSIWIQCCKLKSNVSKDWLSSNSYSSKLPDKLICAWHFNGKELISNFPASLFWNAQSLCTSLSCFYAENLSISVSCTNGISAGEILIEKIRENRIQLSMARSMFLSAFININKANAHLPVDSVSYFVCVCVRFIFASRASESFWSYIVSYFLK